jgi:hypothetical protein
MPNKRLSTIGLEDFDDPAINFRPTQIELGDVIDEGDLGDEYSYDLEDAYSDLPEMSEEEYNSLSEKQRMARFEFFERQMQKMRDKDIHAGMTRTREGKWVDSSSVSKKKGKTPSIQEALGF